MLHTKFQGHRSIASGEVYFLRFLPYMGMVTQLICINFHSHSPLSFHMSFWFQIAQLFLQKTSFNFEIRVAFDQRQRMALTFDTHSTSFNSFS